jgi:hypothetical protein
VGGREINPRRTAQPSPKRRLADSNRRTNAQHVVTVRPSEQESPGYVYVVLRDSDGLLKIGSTRDLTTRLRQLRHEHGDILLVGWVDGNREVEALLHRKYADENVGGEWFDSWRLLDDALDDKLLDEPVRVGLCAFGPSPLNVADHVGAAGVSAPSAGGRAQSVRSARVSAPALSTPRKEAA